MTPVERDHERGLNGALAAEIRAELAVREKTQTWLADEAGVDRLTLRRYLKAQRAMNTALVEAIAEALQLDPGELMARAVTRRNAHPELYGHITHFQGSGKSHAVIAALDMDEPAKASHEEQAAVDRAADRLDQRLRETRPAARGDKRAEMQRIEDEAARDEKRGC